MIFPDCRNVWLKGHTDFGTVTMLYSQPVAALQILARNGQWKWVKHVENALIINAGDSMEFLSGGKYRATIHRVIRPPEDQREYERLGVIYFAMTDDRVRLTSRVGDTETNFRFDGTQEEWRKGRTAAYGTSELKGSEQEKNVEEEVINGVVVRHYN